MKHFLAFLVLLGILGGAGAWNYQQNVALEQQEPRPYRGLSDAELADLAAAYEADIQRFAKRYEAATGRRFRGSGAQLLGEQVRDFEKAQRIGATTRRIGQELSMRESDLKRVKQEQRKRETEPKGMKLHLRRLLTIRS